VLYYHKAGFTVAAAHIMLGLAECGGSSSSTPNPAPMARSISNPMSNGLTATLAADRSIVAVGGAVMYTLTLTNNTTLPITFAPIRMDTNPWGGVGDTLTATDAAGNVAFPIGGFLEVVTYRANTTLSPGQSASGTLIVGADKSLGQFSAAGKYIASVKFDVAEGPYSPSGANPPVADTTVGPLEVDAQ
jgi:uncharacterized repeat protein (TIGR01451 family)